MRFFYVCIFILFTASLLILSCSEKGAKISEKARRVTADSVVGPRTIEVDINTYQMIYYVSDDRGSDQTGNGSLQKPWETVNYTLSMIVDASTSKRYAVFVAEGGYSKATIQMKAHVDIYGGFSAKDWQRDVFKYVSRLGGDKKRRVLVGANNARLDGFVITDGVVRGKGGGMICDGVSPHISNNLFLKNKTLKPIPWLPKYIHEVANDGGALYCSNGASPIIEHNLFVNNATENGRGGAVALNNKCQARISKNIFYQNVSGTDDPMRSSDGGAISVFDWCNPVIEGNVVLRNRADANNDGGGIFVALWSSATITDNVLVGNWSGDDAAGLFVGGQEHRYDGPLDPLPDKEHFYVSIRNNLFIGNDHPSKNSGAMRFTMESRGEFIGNVTAFNQGIYFQRSEVKIAKNVILDRFLFKETKNGLGISEIYDNVLWAEFDLQTAAKVYNNRFKYQYDDYNVFGGLPDFKSDGKELTANSSVYYRQQFITKVLVSGPDLGINELSNRVVRAGDRYSVIRSNDSDTITLWGDFTKEMHFSVLPTYRIQ